MTEKLYNTNSYLKEFDAAVVSCEQNNEGTYNLILDKTGFFPEEGGQSCDKGFVNGIEVLGVQLKDGVIYHKVSSCLAVGSQVHGEIDWEHRFSNMQMHSGEHIFSGLVKNLYGFNNVGFHLSDASATMDYDGKLNADDIKKLEEMTNRSIWENRKVRVFFPNSEEAASLDFRAKPKGIVGDLRLVEIEGVDLCACCAPHVSLTGEIGIFKIVSFENYKGGTRINYLCGIRALRYFVMLRQNLTELGRILNAPSDKLCEAANNLKDNLAKTEFSNGELRRKMILEKIDKNENGVLVLSSDNADLIKFSINELKNKFDKTVAVFAGDDENGYRFMIESDRSDLTSLANELKTAHNAKCGGKTSSVQGSINAKIDLIIRYFC